MSAGALLLAGLGMTPSASAVEPAPRSVPLRLEPCGGAGPDTLEVVLSALAPATDAPGRSSADLLPELHRAICDWFRDDRWRVRFPSDARTLEPSSADAKTLRIVLERPTVTSARLQADGARGRWTHELPLQAGLDDAGIEALAEALHSAAQAESAPPIVRTTRPRPASVDARERAPVTALATETPLLAPASVSATGERTMRQRPRVEGRHLPVHTGLGYQAYARGDEPFMHGPELHIELDALRSRVTLGGFFRASLFSSAIRRTIGFDVRSSGASLSLGAAASMPVAGLTARAGLGGGLDLVAVAARVNDPELVRLLPDRNASPRPFVGAEAGVRYRLGPFELGLDALLRLLLLDTQYQLRTADGPVVLFRPWQLQPGALLELAYVW